LVERAGCVLAAADLDAGWSTVSIDLPLIVYLTVRRSPVR
jgi:hypothetical protein